MKTVLSLVSVLALSFYSALVRSGYVCHNETITQTAKTDFLFLLDISPSMGPKISGVISGLSAFAQRVAMAGLDAQFAIVTFGGPPTIALPLTPSFNEFYRTINSIELSKSGQEASLEAIRLSLRNQGKRMARGCPRNYPISECILDFRSGANKVFILVTDEDSDLPIYDRYPGQNAASSLCVNGVYEGGQCYGNSAKIEPSFNNVLKIADYFLWFPIYHYFRSEPTIRLSDPYEAELKGTADLLAANNVFMNFLIGMDIGTGNYVYGSWPVSAFDYKDDFSYRNLYFKQLKDDGTTFSPDDNTVATYQFGNPYTQSQNRDFSNFDSQKTLDMLVSAGLQNSVQARMLARGNFARVFDVANFVSYDGSTNPIISAFYSQMVATTQYISQQCVFVPDPPAPEPSPVPVPAPAPISSSSTSSSSSSSSTQSSSMTSSTSTTQSTSSTTTSSQSPTTSSTTSTASTSSSSSSATSTSSTSSMQSSSSSPVASSSPSTSSTSATSTSSSSSTLSTTATPASSASSVSSSTSSSTVSMSDSSSASPATGSTSTVVSTSTSATVTSSSTAAPSSSSSSATVSSSSASSSSSVSLTSTTDSIATSTASTALTSETSSVTATGTSTSSDASSSSSTEAIPTSTVTTSSESSTDATETTTATQDDSYYFYNDIEAAIFFSSSKSSNTQIISPPQNESVSGEANKTAAAAAGASVGAAAIGAAALGLFLRRKRAAAMQSTAFNNADGSATANPLYSAQTSIQDNPLFESSSTASRV